MQHIDNQQAVYKIHSNSLQDRWNLISDAVQMEGHQRSDYVMENLSDLQSRVTKSNLIQHSKHKLINQQLLVLKRKAHDVNVDAIQAPNKEQQTRNVLESKTNHFVNQCQQKAQNFNGETSRNLDRRITDIALGLSQNSRTVVHKTQENVKQILKSASNLKNHIASEKNKATKGLEELRAKITEQTSKIEEFISEARKERLQHEMKTESMLNDLDILLNGIVTEEFKSGQVTYDCLLKLFEDTCSKMEAKLNK